jgi:hypothetical protein
MYWGGGHLKSARTSATLNELYCGFPQSIQASVGMTMRLLPFKSLPIYFLSCSTPHSLRYWHHRKTSRKKATGTKSFLGRRMLGRYVAIFSELSRNFPSSGFNFLPLLSPFINSYILFCSYFRCICFFIYLFIFIFILLLLLFAVLYCALVYSFFPIHFFT